MGGAPLVGDHTLAVALDHMDAEALPIRPVKTFGARQRRPAPPRAGGSTQLAGKPVNEVRGERDPSPRLDDGDESGSTIPRNVRGEHDRPSPPRGLRAEHIGNEL
jgi:hypothetical protein